MTSKKTYRCDEVDAAWLLLEQTRNAIFKARELELEQLGISLVQAGVMFVIETTGGRARPAEIARWLVREPHSISGLLTRMEADGLVKRVPDPERKNSVAIVLTAEGQDICDKTFRRESVRHVFAGLSDGERENLMGSLVRLRDRALKDRRVRNRPPFPTADSLTRTSGPE